LEELVRLRPRMVLLCLGGNDALNREPAQQTFANLATMIDRLHQEGSFVVIIGIRSVSLRDHNKKYFAELARQKRVLYVPDMLSGLAFKPVYMSDAIHPNDEGYRRIAERLEKVLKPLLPKLIKQSVMIERHDRQLKAVRPSALTCLQFKVPTSSSTPQGPKAVAVDPG
jgi:lysophospholipase L1-like esterase